MLKHIQLILFFISLSTTSHAIVSGNSDSIKSTIPNQSRDRSDIEQAKTKYLEKFKQYEIQTKFFCGEDKLIFAALDATGLLRSTSEVGQFISDQGSGVYFKFDLNRFTMLVYENNNQIVRIDFEAAPEDVSRFKLSTISCLPEK